MKKYYCLDCGLSVQDKKLYVPTYRKPDQYRHYCLICHRARSAKYRKTFRQKRVNLIRKAKNKPCADCGKLYHYCVMEFDHIRDNKSFTIGDGFHNATLEQIKEEIDKCEVVCSNCHRMRTFKRS